MNPRGFFLTPTRHKVRRIIGSRCFSCILACLAIFCVCSSPAWAAPLPRIVVVRPPEAEDCPDAPALALAVEGQMHRPALDATSTDTAIPAYEVTVSRGKDGYAATIRSGDSIRELSDPGSTCAELADALALTLTILLDSDAAAEAPPSAPAEPKEVPAKPIPAAPKRMSNPQAILRILPRRAWHLGADVAVGETVGFLSPLSFAVDGGISFRYQRFSMGAGVFAIPYATIEDTTNQGFARAYLVTGRIEACARVVGNPMAIQASICGQTLVGAMGAAGSNYVENRQGSLLWVGLGPMVLLRGPLSPAWGWSVRLSVIAPVTYNRFVSTRIEGVGSEARETTFTLFEPAPVAGFLGVGLHFTIL